jgi:hypothetical protein
MAFNYAGDPGVDAAAGAKHIIVPFTITNNAVTPTIAIDAAAAGDFGVSQDLLGKCEFVASAIAGSVVTEQTFTGADITAAVCKVGFGILDGTARDKVWGYAQILGNTVSTNDAAAGGPSAATPWTLLASFTVGGISGQTRAGITSSNNVAVLLTCRSNGNHSITDFIAANGAAKCVLHLFWK